MGFNPRDIAAYLSRLSGQAATPRKRAARFTGRFSKAKEWQLAQIARPGAFLGLRTVSEANRRDHWAAKARRSAVAREQARIHTLAYLAQRPAPLQLPATVTLTRYSPGTLDDDNLASALKAVRDGVAEACGVDDKPGSGLSWEYRQEKAPHYGVRITLSEPTP